MNEVDTSPIGTAQTGDTTQEEKDLLNLLLEWLKTTESATSENNWRTEAQEDYDFYAGKQDTQEVLDLLESQLRSATVYNEVKPKIDMLIGLASQNKRAPMVFPVESNDESLAEVANGAFKHFRRTARVGRNEVECFEHMVKSGRALLHFYIGGDDPFSPEILSKRIHGRDYWLDPLSVEYDLSDARFLFVDKYFTKEELQYYFPTLDPDEIKTMSTNNPGNPSFFSQERDKYRVTECWYRKVEKVFWVMNPLTQRSEALPAKEYHSFMKKIKDGAPMPDGTVLKKEDFPAIEKVRRTVHYAIFSNTKVVSYGPSPYKHGEFPYVQFGAYKDDDENRWFGAITMMKDPQRGINVMRRQLQHLLQTAPKGILVHESGVVLDIDSYEKRSSEPSYHMEIAPGGMGKIKFTDQPSISPVYGDLISIDTQIMKDSSGIQDSLMGVQTSSREPGVTLRMRQETGMAVLFILFDNYREARLQAGKQLLSLIQQYITDEQLIRIEGEEGLKTLKVNSQKDPNQPGFNDISVGRYDLVLDDAMDSQTMRMAILQMLTEYSQNNPGSIPPDLIMEYSDLPPSAKKRVADYTERMLEREERIKMASVEASRYKTASDTAIAQASLDMKEQLSELTAGVKLIIARMNLAGSKMQADSTVDAVALQKDKEMEQVLLENLLTEKEGREE